MKTEYSLGIPAGRNCIVLAVEAPEMVFVFVDNYSRAPLLGGSMKIDPHSPGFIQAITALIAQIRSMVNLANIFDPIISSITVYMVDNLVRKASV